MIDVENLADAFYAFGRRLGNALNAAIDAINSFCEMLNKTESKTKLRELHTPDMDAKAVYESNNWRKMHGYPMRRRRRK